MRRGNGIGTVFKVKGRRKPWRARVTTGWELDVEAGKAKQLIKDIGYFATRQEAEEALAGYQRCPYDLDSKGLTLKEVYEQWSKKHFRGKGDSSRRSVEAAFRYAHPLHNKKIREIRVHHLKECIENASIVEIRGKNKGKVKLASPTVKERMKSMFNMLFDYAEEYEIVDKNYARTFRLDQEIREEGERRKKKIEIFKNDEIGKLWENVDKVKFVDMVLIEIYTGFRPKELAALKVEDVNLEDGIIRGGLKTEAGKNRLVPIHPLIQGMVARRCQEAQQMDSLQLFNDPEGQQGTVMTYDKYRGRFVKVMEKLGMRGHRPHETRHTFITNCKRCGVDDYILKRVVGHKIVDITEGVYTHRNISEVAKEIGKIGKFLPDGMELSKAEVKDWA